MVRQPTFTYRHEVESVGRRGARGVETNAIDRGRHSSGGTLGGYWRILADTVGYWLRWAYKPMSGGWGRARNGKECGLTGIDRD